MQPPGSEVARSEDLDFMSDAPPRRFRDARPALKLLGVVLVTCVVAGAAGLWIGSRVRSPAQIAAEAEAPPASLITAAVEERVITERFSVVGHIRVGQVSDASLLPPEGGSSVVTLLAAEAGDTIGAGALLAEVAGRPVFAVHGLTPVYRTISPGDSGADVDQLQATLVTAGFLAAASATFDAAAQAAVRAMYQAAGYEPAEAAVDLDSAADDVESAEAAVKAAERTLAASTKAAALAVTSAETELQNAKADQAATDTKAALAVTEAQARASDLRETLAELRADDTATATEIRDAETAVLTADNDVKRAEADKTAAATAAAGRVKVADKALSDARSASVTAGEKAAVAAAKQALADARARLAEARLRSGVVVPGAEIVAVSPLPATIAAVGLVVGTPAPGAAAWTFSAGGPIVEAYVIAAQRSAISVGDSASLSVAGSEIVGHVEHIDAQTSASPRGFDGHRVVIRTAAPIPVEALGTETQTTIESELTDGPVRAVPVTAVSVDTDGSPFVTEVAADGSHVEHPVRLGASAAGYVELLADGTGQAGESGATGEGPLAVGATVLLAAQ